VVSVPDDYSSVSIAVSCSELTEANLAILDVLRVIAECVNNVNTTLTDLTLQWWYGQSSSTAQGYIDTWNNAVQGVFGTQQNPSLGIFGRLAMGLGSAAGNYATAEQWITNAFYGMESGLYSSGGGSGGQPQNVVNQPGQRLTAVTEVFD
jgi:hypothetical protein